MRKYKIDLTYDIFIDGKLKESDNFSELFVGKNKKDAIIKAFISMTMAQQHTNAIFCGLLGKIEIKNTKAKYKNKYLEIEKLWK